MVKSGRVFAITATALLAACSGGDTQDAPPPDNTVQQLMVNEIQPTAEIYWNAVQWINDEDGYREIEPETDEDWERVRAAAEQLADHGRLLATPEYSEGRGEDWLDFANALTEISERAEQTAIDKDVEAVFEVGGVVYRVCQSCHTFYPPANPPGADAMAAVDH